MSHYVLIVGQILLVMMSYASLVHVCSCKWITADLFKPYRLILVILMIIIIIIMMSQYVLIVGKILLVMMYYASLIHVCSCKWIIEGN